MRDGARPPRTTAACNAHAVLMYQMNRKNDESALRGIAAPALSLVTDPPPAPTCNTMTGSRRTSWAMSMIERWNEPIFIVGAPRSGTTLLRNMLNRHPAIAICRETVFFQYVYQRRRTFGSLGELRNRRRLITEYLSTQRIRLMQMDSQALEA